MILLVVILFGVFKVPVIDNSKLNKLQPKFKGEHFWIVSVAYKCNPEMQDSVFIADHENIVMFNGPGCYFCYSFYTSEIASQPCRGEGFESLS